MSAGEWFESIDGAFPYVLSLQFVLGCLQLLDVLGVVYYPIIHMEMPIVLFELGVNLLWPMVALLVVWGYWVVYGRSFVVPLLLPACGLLAYPFMGLEGLMAVASLGAVVAGLWVGRELGRFVSGVLLLLSGIEVLSLVHWLLFVPAGLESPLEGVAWLETGLFSVAGYAAPLLVLPFFFVWVLRPLVIWGWGRDVAAMSLRGERYERKNAGYLLLIFSVVLGIFAAYYPYCKSVNPEAMGVGVDFSYYVEKAEAVEGDIFEAFNVSGGSRPMIFLFVNGFQRLMNFDASTAVKFSLLALIPLLVVSAYFMAVEMFDDAGVGVWTAFFTVCGVQVTVGVYSYFLTNLLGLSIVFFSLGFLFRALRLGCHRSLAVASLFGGLLVFTHPWTFDQYAAAIVVLTGVTFLVESRSGGDFRDSRILVYYVACLGLAELIKVFFVHGVGGVSASSAAVGGISGLSEFWFISIFSFRRLYGGTLSVVVLLVLSVIGVYLLDLREFPGVFSMVFLALSSSVFVLGDDVIKSRLLYNVPIGLFAAFGFMRVLNRAREYDLEDEVAVYVFSAMVVYLLRSLANFT
jgi:hypothetical protein